MHECFFYVSNQEVIEIFKSFVKLFKSRDKPKNVTVGSAYNFLFGGSTAGKTVTERSSMVRAKTPYAHIVEFGSKSYTLRAKNKKALTIPGGSALVLRKSAKIPARKGRPFIEPSFEAEEPKIVSSMKKVLNK